MLTVADLIWGWPPEDQNFFNFIGVFRQFKPDQNIGLVSLSILGVGTPTLRDHGSAPGKESSFSRVSIVNILLYHTLWNHNLLLFDTDKPFAKSMVFLFLGFLSRRPNARFAKRTSLNISKCTHMRTLPHPVNRYTDRKMDKQTRLETLPFRWRVVIRKPLMTFYFKNSLF